MSDLKRDDAALTTTPDQKLTASRKPGAGVRRIGRRGANAVELRSFREIPPSRWLFSHHVARRVSEVGAQRRHARVGCTKHEHGVTRTLYNNRLRRHEDEIERARKVHSSR